MKKREWYQLSQDERQQMMSDHFKIGHKYPSVKINTTYSFGLHGASGAHGLGAEDEPS